jgi:hypothetical protein
MISFPAPHWLTDYIYTLSCNTSIPAWTSLLNRSSPQICVVVLLQMDWSLSAASCCEPLLRYKLTPVVVAIRCRRWKIEPELGKTAYGRLCCMDVYHR